MSQISTAYDALITRIETVLDAATNNYTRLPNCYNIEDNTDLKLRKGYGVAILAATNSNRELCKASIERTMEIILTRHYTGAEENAADKASVEKLLLEDQLLIIKDLETSSSLNDTVMFSRWVSDNGIEFVAGETSRFFMLRTQISMEYLENLT